MWTHLSAASHTKLRSPPPGTGDRTGDAITKRILCSAFRQRGGRQRVFLVAASSQVPLAQINPYANVTYFGMIYSEPLYIHLKYAHIDTHVCLTYYTHIRTQLTHTHFTPHTPHTTLKHIPTLLHMLYTHPTYTPQRHTHKNIHCTY